MSDITVAARFTFPGVSGPGEPATGLTLSDINFYLTRQDRETLVDTVIWDGSQNPTDEFANVGVYARQYSGADLDQYNYYLAAEYTGLTTLDQNWVSGAIGIENLPSLGTRIEWPYIVYIEGTSTPIEGVKVEVHRNGSLGTDVQWIGYSNGLGEARDQYGLYPRLDAGLWEFWRFHGDYTWSNPDIEDVQ